MEEKAWKIDLKKPTEEFSQHLEPEDNIHILFSGEFGIGKTYFLDNFFDNKKDEYLAIKLNPVNYSISTNEDIFRLIKYDIVYELLTTHKYKFEPVEYNKGLALSTVISNKINSNPIPAVVSNLIKLLGPLSKDKAEAITPLVESFTTFNDMFAGITDTLQEAKGLKQNLDLKRLKQFLEEVHKQPELELDFATEFIQNALDKLSIVDSQEETKSKCKVLIIDDLDRIDPEHIFRLFNIFSAHLDYKKTALNKFGFDKVVFVCDIMNIRNIFYTKYGVNTDFSGYIDKFYSSYIFYFNNTQAIVAQLEILLRSIKMPSNYSFNIQERFWRTIIEDNSHIFKDMIIANAIKIRSVQKIHNRTYPLELRKELFKSANREVQNWQIPAIMLYSLLEWILGKDKIKVRKAIDLVKRYASSPTTSISNGSTIEHGSIDYTHFIGIQLLYIDHAQHQFKVKYTPDDPYIYKQNGLEIKYLIRQEAGSNFWLAEVIAINFGSDFKSNVYILYHLLELGYHMYINHE